MTQNGLIYLKAVDIKPRNQQIQYVYNIYANLYTFYNKRAFSDFWRNGPKSIENEEYNLFFVKCVCMLTDC